MSLFVTIEGIEGSGKSSLRNRLAEMMPPSDGEVVFTREPGATPLGASVRSLLLDPAGAAIDPVAELMLFAADRAQHLNEVVRPALARGAIVICDRYVHSTLAYQGYGRGLPLDDLWRLNQFVTGGLYPDLVLLLDLAPEEGLRRAKGRAMGVAGDPSVAAADESWSRFEQQELDFHTRVRAGFLALAENPKHNFEVLDASKSADEISILALAAIQRTLSAERGNAA